MNLDDYILPQEGHDWQSMLEDWEWILPGQYTIWIVNRFADLIITKEDGSVWLLGTSGGGLRKLADSQDGFSEMIARGTAFADIFMIPAVDAMVAAGHTLAPGQCYSFRVPPGLGGARAMSNFMVTDLEVHLSIHGQIFSQTKDRSEEAPGGFFNRLFKRILPAKGKGPKA